jgi:hypothetical protein
MVAFSAVLEITLETPPKIINPTFRKNLKLPSLSFKLKFSFSYQNIFSVYTLILTYCIKKLLRENHFFFKRKKKKDDLTTPGPVVPSAHLEIQGEDCQAYFQHNLHADSPQGGLKLREQ